MYAPLTSVRGQDQVGGEERAGERVLDVRFELEPHVERTAPATSVTVASTPGPTSARVVAQRQRRRQRRPAEGEAVVARTVEPASARGLPGRLLRGPHAPKLSPQHPLAATPVEELEDLAVLLREDQAVARRGQHEHARILRREPDRRLPQPRLRLFGLGFGLPSEPPGCRAHAEQAGRYEHYSREPPLHGVEGTRYERTARDSRWTRIFRFTRWRALSIVFVSHPRIPPSARTSCPRGRGATRLPRAPRARCPARRRGSGALRGDHLHRRLVDVASRAARRQRPVRVGILAGGVWLKEA